MTDENRWKEECQLAWDARYLAYAPYSAYLVGCCLMFEDDSYISAANVENSVFGLTECAERVAIFKWKTSKELRNKKPIALIFATNTPDNFAFPCGACLQVMLEFLDPETPIVHFNGKDYVERKLKELLPYSRVITELTSKPQMVRLCEEE